MHQFNGKGNIRVSGRKNYITLSFTRMRNESYEHTLCSTNVYYSRDYKGSLRPTHGAAHARVILFFRFTSFVMCASFYFDMVPNIQEINEVRAHRTIKNNDLLFVVVGIFDYTIDGRC